MTIRAYVMLVCALLLAKPLAAESIPFEVCAESTTWTRPTPEVQAKIWNDARYKTKPVLRMPGLTTSSPLNLRVPASLTT